MEMARPFGLALSGGGFRASAFHLGVLKRLRERGLLHQVDIISTVSGGSITGAYWVYWQATQSDTLHDDAEWDRFEASLIGIMRRGIRGRLLVLGLLRPFAANFAALGAILALLGFLAPSGWLCAATLSAAAAYNRWRHRSGEFLAQEYDRIMFFGTRMERLSQPVRPAEADRSWPRLVVNCTTLNVGRSVIFTHDQWAGVPGVRQIPPRRRTFRNTADLPVIMPEETPVAFAVAASSCFPGVFTPLRMTVPLEIAHELGGAWYNRARLPYTVSLTDGGVFDNQGTYPLINARCRSLIVSDASATLRPVTEPSTWQMFPIGRGIVWRTRDIIYDRVSELGRSHLREMASVPLPPANPDAPSSARSYLALSYLEINPGTRGMGPLPVRLTEAMSSYAAKIRTDLDRFSDLEIATLLFQGYSVADRHVEYTAEEFNLARAHPPVFRSADPAIKSDWTNTESVWLARPKEAAGQQFELELGQHLEASSSRSAIWRFLRRWRNRSKAAKDFGDGTPDYVDRAVLAEQEREEKAAARWREKREADRAAPKASAPSTTSRS